MISDFFFNLDHFRITKSIGGGAFATVFLIKNDTDDRQYVIKINQREDIPTEERQRAFMREVQTFSEVRYPTILGFIGYNLSGFPEYPYPTIITEYLPNGSLHNILESERNHIAPDGWTDTSKYIVLLGLTLGMKKLHSKGIVHRDLKPDNILLGDNYYPKISDFGISKLTHEQLTQILMHTYAGTPLYMAPEILRGDEYSSSVDIYSFALIAYELITLQNPPAQIERIQIEDNRSFINKCLSLNPQDRPTFNDILKYIITENFMSEFKNIDFDEVKAFLDIFEDEDPDALFTMANILSREEDDHNRIGSSNYYKKSADKGNNDAMISYACMLYNGNGIAENKPEAARYYKMSADAGDSSSMNEYGQMLQNGDGIDKDIIEAIHYYKMAISKGNSSAMYNYAKMLKNGEGVAVNLGEANRYYKMAADNGNEEAMNEYGQILQNGDGIDADIVEAIHYYMMAISKGNSSAMYNYANMLKNGEGVAVNLGEATRYYKMSADNGNDEAMCIYGNMLIKGDNIETNKPEAARYFKMAADKGNEEAISIYSLITDYGDDIDLEKAQKARNEKIMADQGNIYSMFSYADILEKGDGIPINKPEAARYYKMSADQGHGYGMLCYAEMLQKGDGIPINKPEAARYYKMSADQGHGRGMRCYAEMLQKGDGIPIDREEASRYYKLAKGK